MPNQLRVRVVGEPGLAAQLLSRLQIDSDDPSPDVVVYVPDRAAPDLAEAEALFQQWPARRLVLVSSARAYGALPQNPGLITEQRPRQTNCWVELEALATRMFASRPGGRLGILRPSTIVWSGGKDSVNRLFQSRIALTLPGHDPGIQLLSVSDFAEAVARAIHAGHGTYNVAPGDAIPLRHAIRLARASRLPVPRTVQRFFPRSGELDYLRYSWTVSNQKIKTELGFSPAKSSSQALLEALGRDPAEAPSGEFDIFGQDKSYIAAFGRTLFDFLYRRYWRVEEKGVDHVPRAGRAVLVGVHRGFMPWDGVMALHSVVQRLGRYPRFLIHPSLVKFPFLFNYMRKLGGIIACQENAEYVLDHDEMVGIFPEGIRGAFTLYRNAYQLGKFTSDDYVKLALRKGAAIVPFVTVGSAEIFPILAKWNWNWWKKYTGFPAFPITPTFPFLPPLPLPAKWHTQWLASIPAGTEYPPEAASDPAIVRSINEQVRSVMQRAMDDMRARRRSKFAGSVFETEAAPSVLPSHKQSIKEQIG